MTPSIAVVGSVNVDLVATVEALPRPGETVVGPGLTRHGGGKGANVATACARLGAATTFVGAIGADNFGIQARWELEAAGVDVSELEVLEDESTGTAMIAVDGDGENQIIVGLGANQALRPERVVAALDRRRDSWSCVVVGTEIRDETVVAAVRWARDAGVQCVLVPAPARAALLDAVAQQPVLTPNVGEAEILAAALGADAVGHDRLAPALAEAAGVPVVMTRGERGAVVARPGAESLDVPAPHVEVVDTTGAGDTFAGALAVRLAEGSELAAAARYAVVAAALSVTRAGAREGMPRAKAVLEAMG